MSRKYKIRNQDKLYFVTLTVVEWIDLFTRQEYRDIFIGSLKFCQAKKGMELCAYCIMSSHIHFIIGRNGEVALEAILRDLKKYTAVQFIKSIQSSETESRQAFLLDHFGKAGRKNPNNLNFQVWQQHNHPIELNSPGKITRCLHYIHQNPVEAGIVLSAEEYLYSSAASYAGSKEKLIDLVFIE